MSDLDAAIRARLKRPSDAWGNLIDGYGALAGALLAVLDLHAAPERALPGEIHCGELMDWVQGGCPTVRAIAKALGIEAGNG